MWIQPPLLGAYWNRTSTTGAERPTSRKSHNGAMNVDANTSSKTVGGISRAEGRLSKVTLGLLLSTRLQVNRTEAHTSGLARLQRATDGMSSSLLAYIQQESTPALRLSHQATFRLWLTQFATAEGFLLASGGQPRSWSSCRIQLAAIQRMWVAPSLFNVGAFTIKVANSRAITRWVVGDGRFNHDTNLETLSGVIWRAETTLLDGLPLTSLDGLTIGQLAYLGARQATPGFLKSLGR